MMIWLLTLALGGGAADDWREHLRLAEVARRAADFEEVVRRLQAAYQLAPSPELLNNLGRTLEELGRYAEAAEAYRRVVDDPQAPPNLRALDAGRRSALANKLGRAWVVVNAWPGVEVAVSGERTALGAESSAEPGRSPIELVEPERRVLRLRFLTTEPGRRFAHAEPRESHGDGLIAVDLAELESLEVDGYRLRLVSSAQSVALPAGSWRMRVVAGVRSKSLEVKVAAGARMSLSELAPRPPPAPRSAPAPIVLAPRPKDPERTLSALTVILGATGVVAAGVGAALGGMALGAVDVSAVDPRYPNKSEDARSFGTGANIGLGVATAALLGAGVSLIVDLASGGEEEGS